MEEFTAPPKPPRRHRLPDERLSMTHTYQISGRKGYIIVGFYEQGMPGEIFAGMSPMGGREASLLDAWCVMVSIGLQCGMPLDVVVSKFRGWTFEPHGMTTTPDIPFASSPIDYIVQWLEKRFMPPQED